MATSTEDRLVRDEAFARRLEQACDASPHCPPLHKGRLTWLADQMRKAGEGRTSPQAVSRWTNGEAKPRQAKNVKLAQILSVDPHWLYVGVDPGLAPRELKLRNAMADGVINVVAGLIQMDGGSPAFPEESDKRAQRDHVDLYAVIKGANYSFHVSLGAMNGAGWQFAVPAVYEHIVILGVVREGFSLRIVELCDELIGANGTRSTGKSIDVTLGDDVIHEHALTSFAQRL